MARCFFVSDLHGRPASYRRLFAAIDEETPDAVFLGGDLLPSFGFGMASQDEEIDDFIQNFLIPEFLKRSARTRVFLILGNDDPRALEEDIRAGVEVGAWEYLYGASAQLEDHTLYGYPYVPPTPFHLKDWEKYDVSRYTDPGCVSPEEGGRSAPADRMRVRHETIRQDLEALTQGQDLSRAILLFHVPPYRTQLDRGAMDGKMIDHVPLDVHLGSIAVRRFIETRQPLLTLHGHIHESTRLTGSWRDRIGRTHLFSAAHDGPETALIRFSPSDLPAATRDLLA